jgi:hypothetical protein
LASSRTFRVQSQHRACDVMVHALENEHIRWVKSQFLSPPNSFCLYIFCSKIISCCYAHLPQPPSPQTQTLSVVVELNLVVMVSLWAKKTESNVGTANLLMQLGLRLSCFFCNLFMTDSDIWSCLCRFDQNFLTANKIACPLRIWFLQPE